MGKRRKELSHAEVWDDSALLQSWDDALEEYKLYHSIHARGERVEDVIAAFKSADQDGIDTAIPAPTDGREGVMNDASLDALEDGELGEGELGEAATAGVGLKSPIRESYLNGDQSPTTTRPKNLHAHPETVSGNQQQAVSGMPDAITNGVQDGALKNLMMSWYYAGYYSGLYEGQQQAQNATSK